MACSDTGRNGHFYSSAQEPGPESDIKRAFGKGAQKKALFGVLYRPGSWRSSNRRPDRNT